MNGSNYSDLKIHKYIVVNKTKHELKLVADEFLLKFEWYCDNKEERSFHERIELDIEKFIKKFLKINLIMDYSLMVINESLCLLILPKLK